MTPPQILSGLIFGFALAKLVVVARLMRRAWRLHRMMSEMYLGGFVLAACGYIAVVYGLNVLGVLSGQTFVILARSCLLLAQAIILALLIGSPVRDERA